MSRDIALDKLKNKWSKVDFPSALAKSTAINLLVAAFEARKNAYARYSSFKVGAAALTKDGSIFKGCNVENASYGATICAERAAIFNLVSAGHSSIIAIAVIAEYQSPIPPCGMCRQVIAEFGKDILILMSNTAGDVMVESIEALLPKVFGLRKAGE